MKIEILGTILFDTAFLCVTVNIDTFSYSTKSHRFNHRNSILFLYFAKFMVQRLKVENLKGGKGKNTT